MNDHGPALLVFEVPGEPRGKGRHRAGRSRTGAVVQYADQETVSYERTVAWIARQAMGKHGVRELLKGPLWMQITAFMMPPKALHKKVQTGKAVYPVKKFDWDNIAKVISDALNTVVYADDSQIADGRVVKRWAMLPRVVVSIGSLDDKTALCHDGGPCQP